MSDENVVKTLTGKDAIKFLVGYAEAKAHLKNAHASLIAAMATTPFMHCVDYFKDQAEVVEQLIEHHTKDFERSVSIPSKIVTTGEKD